MSTKRTANPTERVAVIVSCAYAILSTIALAMIYVVKEAAFSIVVLLVASPVFGLFFGTIGRINENPELTDPLGFLIAVSINAIWCFMCAFAISNLVISALKLIRARKVKT